MIDMRAFQVQSYWLYKLFMELREMYTFIAKERCQKHEGELASEKCSLFGLPEIVQRLGLLPVPPFKTSFKKANGDNGVFKDPR